LSPKACAGLLRRAEKCGKLERMPEALRKALEAASGMGDCSPQEWF
jgi:hypothetical protein